MLSNPQASSGEGAHFQGGDRHSLLTHSEEEEEEQYYSDGGDMPLRYDINRTTMGGSVNEWEDDDDYLIEKRHTLKKHGSSCIQRRRAEGGPSRLKTAYYEEGLLDQDRERLPEHLRVTEALPIDNQYSKEKE